MSTFVIILHVVVALLLTLVVLLQPGNKGGMGAAFGGAGGSTVFGGRGANTFLAKLTAGAAALFMVTSMSLVYLSSRSGSAFDRTAAPGGDATQPELPPPGPDVPVVGEEPADEAATDLDAPIAPAAEPVEGDAPEAAPADEAAPAAEAAPAPEAAPALEAAPAPAAEETPPEN